MSCRCRLCHRLLKDPESKRLGYGPVCYKREFGSPMPKEKKTVKMIVKEKNPDGNIPGQLTLADVFGNISFDEQDAVKN